MQHVTWAAWRLAVFLLACRARQQTLLVSLGGAAICKMAAEAEKLPLPTPTCAEASCIRSTSLMVGGIEIPFLYQVVAWQGNHWYHGESTKL